MTREEQILSEVQKRFINDTTHIASKINTFVDGAKWADEHPDSNHTYTKQQLIDMGFAFTTNGDIVTPKQENEHLKKYLQYQRGKLIDKACEWLKNTIDDDVFVNCGNVIKYMLANEFVEYFRREMEE